MNGINHLQRCEQLTEKFSQQLLNQCWQQLDSRLDQTARKISDPNRRNRHYLAMQEVRFKEAQVAASIADSTGQHFSCFSNVQAFSYSASSDALGKPKQNDSLAITRAIRNTCQDQHQALWQLRQRLSLLRGGQRCEDDDNPLTPGPICLAFQSAVRELEVDPRIRLSLYEIFSALFQQQAADFYRDVNQYLIDAGILANLLPRAADLPDIDTQEITATQALPEKRAQQLEQIQALLCKQRQWPAAIEDGFDLAETLASASYLSAGILLQRQIAAHVDFQRDQLVAPDSTLRQYFKYLAAQMNRQHAGASEQVLVSLELMTRLFQTLCSDERVPLQLRCLLSYLHAPYLKLAIVDRDFFLSPEHPARELLDLLLHQGSLWLLSHADDPSPIATLRTLVSTLACKLSEESNNFSTALGELRAYLAPLHQRCTETERREVQTQASMAFLDNARTLAQQQVLQALQHYQVDHGLGSHLVGPGTDFLTFILLQHGQGRHWTQAQRLLKGIALSVKGELPKGQLIQFQRGQQRLYNAVARGLADTGYEGMLAQDMLASLRLAQQQMVQQLALAEPKPDYSSRQVTDDSALARQQLEALQTGQWYLFADRPHMSPILLKLAWRSDGCGRALFVDASGTRRRLEYADSLARAIDKDQLQSSTLPSRRHSGEALDTILHQLRLNALRHKLKRKTGPARKIKLKIC